MLLIDFLVIKKRSVGNCILAEFLKAFVIKKMTT